MLSPTRARIPIPNEILDSRLLQAGGFAVYEGLFDWRMVRESLDLFSSAQHQESSQPDFEEIRGGTPPRKLLSGGGGPVQDSLYRAGWLSRFITQECALPVGPSGNRGSYSYYARAGDCLGVHRDIPTCDIAVISLLHDNFSSSEEGGALVVYPDRVDEPLSEIRKMPGQGALRLTLSPGHTVLLFGGIVPHQVLPVVEGQVRIISALCFQILLR